MEALAKLPSLNDLRGKLVSLLQAPASKIARLTKEPATKVLKLFQKNQNNNNQFLGEKNGRFRKNSRRFKFINSFRSC